MTSQFLLSCVSDFLPDNWDNGVLLPGGGNVHRIFLPIGGQCFLSNTSAGVVWVFIALPFAHRKAAGYKWDAWGAGGSFLNSQTAPVSTRAIQHSCNSALVIWNKISHLEQDADYWSLITLPYTNNRFAFTLIPFHFRCINKAMFQGTNKSM